MCHAKVGWGVSCRGEVGYVGWGASYRVGVGCENFHWII